jgi:hypothetical protein
MMDVEKMFREAILRSRRDGVRHITFQTEIIMEAVEVFDKLNRGDEAGKLLRAEFDVFDNCQTVDVPKVIKAYDAACGAALAEKP